MFAKHTKLAALLMAVVLPLAACDDGVTTSQTGPVSILLTDVPGDVQAAVVTIEGIYLQGTLDDDGSRVWLMEDAVTTDLLTLANDALELVGDAEVPTGTYAQLRFVISGGYLEVEAEGEDTQIFASPGYEHVPAGRTVDGDLQMPSLAQTGIKVNLPGDAVQVGATGRILLVDFNVAESFGQGAGGSGMWVMTPVIQAVDFDVSSTVTVTLALDEGVELPAGVTLADFTAHLADGSGNTKEDPFQANESESYTAVFSFLLPGETWALDVEAPEGLAIVTDPALPNNLETVSGGNTEVEVTITSAEGS